MKSVVSSSFHPLSFKPSSPSFHFSSHNYLSSNLPFKYAPFSPVLSAPGVRCTVSSGPSGPTSGENESKNILDAFFLGKALAEAVNERVESAVGEFLGTITRLQAEQQRQIQDFQADVLERAEKAKLQAARETAEAQEIALKSTTVSVTPSVSDGDVSPYAGSAANASNLLPYSIAGHAADTNSDAADEGAL